MNRAKSKVLRAKQGCKIVGYHLTQPSALSHQPSMNAENSKC